MKVTQHLKGEAEIRNGYHRYQIWDNGGELQGSLYINRTRLVWCEGRTRLANGSTVRWEDFIRYMES